MANITDEKVRVGLVMPKSLRDNAKKLAESKGLDMSSLVRMILIEELKKNK